MNNIGVFKNDEYILLNESFDGFFKIFVNLLICSISAKLGLMALAEGNQITAVCYAVVAGILLVLAMGYFLINIIAKTMKSYEIRADKLVGDAATVAEAEKRLLIQQIGFGALAFLTVGGLYSLGAWSLAEMVVSQFF